MSEGQSDNHAERIGKLETAVEDIRSGLNMLRKGQDDIQRTLAESGKANWTVIFTGLAVLLSFGVVMWGAAIHPLNMDINRSEKSAETLAEAVKLQNVVIQELQIHAARLQDHQDSVLDTIKRFDEKGSAAADNRLDVIEWRLNHEQQK